MIKDKSTIKHFDNAYGAFVRTSAKKRDKRLTRSISSGGYGKSV